MTRKRKIVIALLAVVWRGAYSLEGSITLRDVKKNLDELDPDQSSDDGKAN